ncbi:MAG TPA: NnrU family protein [Burkholderiales bacterium]|nr:NnrU family protein [Burkholderiales bacterium]
MDVLILATAAFLMAHFVTSTPLRPALVNAMGEWPYRGVYSLVAFVTLAWMIWAYVQTPREALLWTPLRLVPLLVMPVAFILIVCGYWRNPTLVGAEKLLKSEDPARGMIRVTRHPLMWGIMLWSGAHIVARADAKSIVFFGGFFVLATLGTVLMDRRKRDDPDFRRFAAVTSNVPFVAIAQGRNRLAWREIGWARPLVGIAVFAALFLLHGLLFGARPY